MKAPSVSTLVLILSAGLLAYGVYFRVSQPAKISAEECLKAVALGTEVLNEDHREIQIKHVNYEGILYIVEMSTGQDSAIDCRRYIVQNEGSEQILLADPDVIVADVSPQENSKTNSVGQHALSHPPALFVDMTADGRFFVQGIAVSIAGLAPRLLVIADGMTSSQVVLAADKETPYQSVLEAMRTLELAGFLSVRVERKSALAALTADPVDEIFMTDLASPQESDAALAPPLVQAPRSVDKAPPKIETSTDLPQESLMTEGEFQAMMASTPEVETEAPLESASQSQPLTISITDQGLVYLQTKVVTDSELIQKLLEIASSRKLERVFLRADRSVPFRRVSGVMKALNSAGFNNIALVTDFSNNPINETDESLPAEAEEPQPIVNDAEAEAVAAALVELAAKDESISETISSEGPPMTEDEIESLRNAIYGCWNVGSLSASAQRVKLTLRIEMNQDGSPIARSIQMTNYEGGNERAAKEAFDAAKRAVLRGLSGCGGRPSHKLDPNKFKQWAIMNLTFDLAHMEGN